MRRSPSLTEVAKAAAQAAMLGPTQRQKLKGRDPAKRSVAGKLTCLAICFAIGLSCICFFWGTPVSALPALFLDTLLMRRLPATAQDNESALAAVLITLLPLAGLDVVLRAVVVRSDGPRWFLLPVTIRVTHMYFIIAVCSACLLPCMPLPSLAT